jgi:c-di-GMP-binding flagellar brake protein YcgR
MQEKRQYLRFNTKGSVLFKTKEAQPRYIRGELVDISALGMAVYSQDKIEVGINAQFELKLEIIDSLLIGECKIKYLLEIRKETLQAFRIGVEFIEIEKKNILYIISRLQEDHSAAERKKRF